MLNTLLNALGYGFAIIFIFLPVIIALVGIPLYTIMISNYGGLFPEDAKWPWIINMLFWGALMIIGILYH